MNTKVTYVSGSSSPGMLLPQGRHVLWINATDWNGATAYLQEAEENVDELYVDLDDPLNSGTPVTRTAKGPSLSISGGGYVRLRVTGSPVGLTLSRQWAE